MSAQHPLYPFSALLSRMKYITRWGLMRSTRSETLSEHTTEAALLAHMLALIATKVLHQKGISAEKVAVAALYHDASEILTGDLPTPVKYKNEMLKNAYKALEKESAQTLACLVPKELHETMGTYLLGSSLNDEEKLLLSAADKISALVKCIEEEASGNTEFTFAKKMQMDAIQNLNCEAADYFLAHFLPCYQQNLDELSMQ